MAGKMNAGMYSSDSDEWETPQELFSLMDSYYHFETDVCATKENAKCKHYYTKADNGLIIPWRGVCWCNPPYGRAVKDWVEKAKNHYVLGEALTVMLLAARTDTKYFHDYILPHGDITFIKGRLKFSGQSNSAPFPSMIVVFGEVRHQKVVR